MSIGTYLLDRLHELGVRHVFGVPGDFTLKLCKLLEEDGRIQFVGTTREDTAGFAADGYARRHEGLGVVLVTHGVGALSTVNPIAGANAESSPVLVLSGAPGRQEWEERPLIHHCFGPYGSQIKIFENFTCSAVALNERSHAFGQIDQVLESIWNKKKPGYIEVPRDLVDREIPFHAQYDSFRRYEASDEETLEEALAETVELLSRAESPMILAGVELHRYGVQNELVQLAETSQLPVAATIMGKSVINERHPLYQGVYQGMVGPAETREQIESADLLITLGVMFTDINLGMYTAQLDPNRMVQVNQGEITIKHHKYSRITLKDFMNGLGRRVKPGTYRSRLHMRWSEEPNDASPAPRSPEEPLTTSKVIQILNQKITPELSVVCDTGDCLFAAVDLKVSDKTAFFASAFYTTMGFAVPAALGVNCASPETRPLILVGDGAFQMTGTELSTFRKFHFIPVVIVLNNGGYETERVILDGKFNDIPEWDYGSVCRLIHYGKATRVRTAGEFQSAVDQALADRTQMHLIDTVVTESSRGMRKLAEEISRRV
ncbi:MAG: alpha-keto acid decarboxylase family protein [Nitrospinaceae bacterium]|nr:alpha-keto acid decarboxylase family protein [Nitrospinaceae bacterium]NIS84858.1 alpha-keto acid decarboxylase family protein [Nitrospinaceae bacterium]NIT81670.1 alpha-keto acid decarboxylase family protein [Nitrospinaceae bacterium]NIU45397.1 alpha-keto acid decarboxylase family protein [Nitrospinaceae bacterium]NIU97551.1 alpha-keto acid decarboxylase family protein [Nitrospinaceae bacterium]